MQTRKYHVEVNVRDARSSLLLGSMGLPVTCRIEHRAKILAIEEAKRLTLQDWALNWFRTTYGITEAQFFKMVEDGVIDPCRKFIFEVNSIKIQS